MGLDAVEWYLELEATFGVVTPDEAIDEMHTIGATRDYIVARVDPAVWPRERVEAKMLDLVTAHFGVARAKIRWDMHYVRDLGA